MNIISDNIIILTTEDDRIIGKATMQQETTRGVSIFILLKLRKIMSISGSTLALYR